MRKFIHLIILLSLFLNAKSDNLIKLTPFHDASINLWGYKDLNNNIVIEAKFEKAAPFYADNYRELTIAKIDNKWVLINEEGKIKKKFDFDDVSLNFQYQGWLYKKDNLYGFIDDEGKNLTKKLYSGIWMIGKDESKSNLFLYKQNDKFGFNFIHSADKSYIDKLNDNKYDDVLYGDLTNIYNPSDNLLDKWATKQGLLDIDGKGLIAKYKKEFGIINTSNTNFDVLNYYDSILPFQLNGFFKIHRISKNKKWGLLFGYFNADNNPYVRDQFGPVMGKEILEPKYESLMPIGDKYSTLLNSKKGLLNSWGQTLLQPEFDDIEFLSSIDLIAYKKGNLWGFTKPNISEITNPEYDSYFLNFISNDYFISVTKNKNWGVLKKTGEKILEPQFQEIKFITNDNNSTYTKSMNKWGVYSLINGNMICPNIYDSIEINDPIGFHIVTNSKKKGLLNNYYQQIVSPELDQILNVNIIGQDTFYIVQKDRKWGSIDITNRDYQWQNNKDLQFSIYPQFLSISELKKEFENKLERIKVEKEKFRLAEIKRIEIERLAEIKKQEQEKIRLEKEAKLAELTKIQNIRNSNIWGVAKGDYYGGGTVYEIFEDGSGIKIISDRFTSTLKEAENFCKTGFSKKMYIAHLDDIYDAFNLGIFTHGSINYNWVVGNNTGQYGKYMTISENAIISFPGGYSTSRVAYLVNWGQIQDMYSGFNEDAVYHIACIKTIGKND